MAEYQGAERRALPDYPRIDVTDLTPRTAPPYAMLTFIQRNSYHVRAPDGSGKLLVGRYGVPYFPDGKPSNDGIYLRRQDRPPVRGPRGQLSQSGNDPQETGG